MNNSKVKTQIIQQGELKNKEDPYEFNTEIDKIINISIQAPPGLAFYINDNENPIIIGPNGLFSWEIKRPNTYIYSIKLKKEGNNWPSQITSFSTIIVTYEYV